MTTAIYAWVPSAKREDLNDTFIALGYGGTVFDQRLTTDDPALTSSTPTDYGMYNAGARPQDITDYASAKAGSVLPLDLNGNAVSWGVEGVISETDAFAAFATLQIFVNDSDVDPGVFAAACRDIAGRNVVPDEA